jgi:hypothetical protein
MGKEVTAGTSNAGDGEDGKNDSMFKDLELKFGEIVDLLLGAEEFEELSECDTCWVPMKKGPHHCII